ncbi:MAG: hypothetical protein CSA96_07785 [Bacteroidetes bacterium]|nr:MAG: hypothetical protein CSA96_07785 [Bacteroidota bacterium]
MAPARESGAIPRKGTEVGMAFNSEPARSPDWICALRAIGANSNIALNATRFLAFSPLNMCAILVNKYSMISANCRNLQYK